MFDVVPLIYVFSVFGGLSFLSVVSTKLLAVREMCTARGLSPRIAVDSGITPETIGLAREAGADAFVAGSAIFGHHDYRNAIAALRAGAH
jgi:ribulose-phosphate 3-epimerase